MVIWGKFFREYTELVISTSHLATCFLFCFCFFPGNNGIQGTGLGWDGKNREEGHLLINDGESKEEREQERERERDKHCIDKKKPK